MQNKRVYLIDASIYFFRHYFTMPEKWQALNGFSTAGTMGYFLWLQRFLTKVNPCYVTACFDESLGTGFRHELYSGYKASRVLPDEALSFELLLCQDITQALGVNTLSSNKYEADDLIATLAYKARKKHQLVTVISSDKDLAQCVLGEHDCIWDYGKRDPLNAVAIKEQMGVRPDQVASYLALVGDVSDDIPGVPHLGKKTACALLAYFNDWPALKKELNTVERLPIRRAAFFAQQLMQYEAQIDLAYALTQAETKAPLPLRFSTKRKRENTQQLDTLLIAAGIKKPKEIK